jgi:two-component system response regulator YesN
LYKVLIAEDESLERKALIYILQNSQLPLEKLVEAVNGKQAVSKAFAELPDIVVLDIKMPGIDGLEAGRQIKAACPDCKIIFLTAFGFFDYAQQAIQIGVEDYIIKPVNDQKLIAVFQKTIAKLDAERQNRARYQETVARLEQVTHFFKNEILASMVAEDIEAERMDEYITQLNITFRRGVAAVLSLNNFSETNAKLESLWKRVNEIMQKQLEGCEVQFLSTRQQGRVYLLLIFGETEACLQQIVREFVACLKAEMSDLQIGVSEVFNRMALVNHAFFQARIAHDNTGESLVTERSFVTKDIYSADYPNEIERHLCITIAKGDENAALEAFQQLWEWMVHSVESSVALTENAYRLVVVIERWANKEFNFDRGFNFSNYHDFACYTHSNDLKAHCWEVLRGLIREIQAGMREPSALSIEEICQYIAANYMKELSLDEIANRVGFSRFYFSKLFKQYKGLNFIDYLTGVRIQKSKELLKNSRLSVKDISYKVGYSDPNYYTSVFKKKEGLSPSEYRNKCC